MHDQIEAPPAKRPIRVIVIDDDAAMASLCIDALQTGLRDADVRATQIDSPSFAGDLLHADVCVCSFGPTPAAAFDTLARLLLMRPELPVVLLAPACEAGRVPDAIRAGAADVLLRTPGFLVQLPPTVLRVSMHARGVGYAGHRYRQLCATLEAIEVDNSKLQALVARLESLAATDSLTGLLNRRAIDAALARAFATSKRYGHELSCLVLDVDGFKGVNDALGHARGDELLRLLASVIIAECRQSDVAGRLGGDEFVVLLPHTGPVEAAAVAQRLRRRFDADARAACGLADDAPPVGLSIGVASRLAHGASDPAAVLNAADAALYQAKRAGRDVVRVASMSAASAASIRRAG